VNLEKDLEITLSLSPASGKSKGRKKYILRIIDIKVEKIEINCKNK